MQVSPLARQLRALVGWRDCPLPCLPRRHAGLAEGLAVVKRIKIRGFHCKVDVYRNSNVDCGLFCS